MPFHWRDGWYFARLADGSVEISRDFGGVKTIEMTIPGAEWASIVAAVSAKGETTEQYHSVREMHEDPNATIETARR